jgi:hypothetical protein
MITGGIRDREAGGEVRHAGHMPERCSSVRVCATGRQGRDMIGQMG